MSERGGVYADFTPHNAQLNPSESKMNKVAAVLVNEIEFVVPEGPPAVTPE